MSKSLTAGMIDSGVDTGNESNDIDINISADVDVYDNPRLSDELIQVVVHKSIQDPPANVNINKVCSPIGNFLGSRLSVSGSEESDNDKDIPPPPPPTSPNICARGLDFSIPGIAIGTTTASEDTNPGNNSNNVDVEFTGLNENSILEGDGSNVVEPSEDMDRDFNEDEKEDFIDEDSPILANIREAREIMNECGNLSQHQPFQFYLNPMGGSLGSIYNEFADNAVFNNGYHSRLPPAPPVTPTNTCKALIKFEFPELPKLVCQFVESPSGLRSTLTLEPFKRETSSGVNILQGQGQGSRSNSTAATDCRAIMPYYDQHDLCQKIRSHTRAVRNKLFDNWANVRKEQSSVYSCTHNERRLRTAAQTSNPQMVNKLLQGGVNPNAKDEHGRTALHIAACKGNSEIIRLLLQSGADPNQKDTVGNTPLHLAACTNHCEAVTCLLRAGTDIRTLDNHGRNPLQLARSKLKLLATSKCDSGDSIKVKIEVQQIIEMMLEYLQKRGQDDQAELLNSFASRLTLSQTPEEVDADVKDLLANLSSLSIAPESANTNPGTSSVFGTPAPDNARAGPPSNINLAFQNSFAAQAQSSSLVFPTTPSSSRFTNPVLSLQHGILASIFEGPGATEEQNQNTLISNLSVYRDKKDGM